MVDNKVDNAEYMLKLISEASSREDLANIIWELDGMEGWKIENYRTLYIKALASNPCIHIFILNDRKVIQTILLIILNFVDNMSADIEDAINNKLGVARSEVIKTINTFDMIAANIKMDKYLMNTVANLLREVLNDYSS